MWVRIRAVTIDVGVLKAVSPIVLHPRAYDDVLPVESHCKDRSRLLPSLPWSLTILRFLLEYSDGAVRERRQHRMEYLA